MTKPIAGRRVNNNPRAPLTPDDFAQPALAASETIAALRAEVATLQAEVTRLKTSAETRAKYVRRDALQLKSRMSNEQKRHASIEALTLQLVSQYKVQVKDLQQQVSDLRSAAFQNLGAQFTPQERR